MTPRIARVHRSFAALFAAGTAADRGIMPGRMMPIASALRIG